MIDSNWITSYISLPWQEGGRSVLGTDCWGLVCMVYKQEKGVALPTLSGADISHDTRFRIITENPLEFDLAFFDAWPNRSHVGIVLNPNNWILHATKMGVHAKRITDISKLNPEYYRWH